MSFRDYDTRLAAYAVVVDDRGRVLLALWNGGPEPQWTMPGGGVHLEETVEQAAVRELREETGYDVRLGRLLAVDSWYQSRPLDVGPDAGPDAPARAHKSVRVVFEAAVVGGELAAEVDGSTDEARWFALAEVPGLPRASIVDVALGAWLDARG